MPDDKPPKKEHTIDPEIGIWPMSEWGAECGRGFVSNERFARGGEKVIKRTNRQATRKWRKLARKAEVASK